MRSTYATALVSALIVAAPCVAEAQTGLRPVTPNASPEAVRLLEYLYSISGRHILTGQHCVPLAGSTCLPSMHKQTQQYYPAVFGQDFGFSEPGTWDGINYRQQIVDEAIRRHHEGFIITLMWHAVRPIEEEPVVFETSIQGRLTDAQWQDLTTPGTDIHERWQSQVDVIAFFLKQLKAASVPVLWRPYHEMNGGWFWWGRKTGDDGYRKLYRMLYDRLVKMHGLTNLLWVFNGNEVREGIDPYEMYFPGHDVVDVLATDVYCGGFAQHDYEQLLALAGDKPIALGEVGPIPDVDILRAQPRWTWFMSWSQPASLWREGVTFMDTFRSEEALTLDELPWVDLKTPRVHYPVLK